MTQCKVIWIFWRSHGLIHQLLIQIQMWFRKRTSTMTKYRNEYVTYYDVCDGCARYETYAREAHKRKSRSEVIAIWLDMVCDNISQAVKINTRFTERGEYILRREILVDRRTMSTFQQRICIMNSSFISNDDVRGFSLLRVTAYGLFKSFKSMTFVSLVNVWQ